MSDTSPLSDFEDVNERVLAAVPEAREAWSSRKAAFEVAKMLVRLRERKGLRQVDIATRTGWDKAFVSRLERPNSELPSLATLIRYAAACDAQAGIVLASAHAPQVHVDDAVALAGGGVADEIFSGLRDRDIELDEEAFGVQGG